MTDDGDEETQVFTVKKSNLSRLAIEKNALRKSIPLSSDQIPLRQAEERPRYSTDDLNELKSATPSKPQDLGTASQDQTDESKAIDLAAKFGSDLSVYENTSIPTDAEIQEKKRRRARLAKEEEFIDLNSSEESDNDRTEITLRPNKEKLETRLAQDDEDVAEGFDEFVEDGRIALGRKAEREQRKRQKDEMRNMINEAEGNSSGDDTDESEAERRVAYEAAQTRAGMDGLQKDSHGQPERPRTPPKITSLPSLNSCLEKLEASLSKMQYERMQRLNRMEEIRKEKDDIGERAVEIQRLLNEAAATHERLSASVASELVAATNGQMAIQDGKIGMERGLESLGATPVGDVDMQSP